MIRSKAPDPKALKMVEEACNFYGITQEMLLDRSNKVGSRVRIRMLIANKLVRDYNMTPTEAAVVLGCTDWNITMYIRKMDNDSELQDEYINVLGDL